MFFYVKMGKVSAVLAKLTNRAGSLWRTWDRDWERAGLKYWNWSSNLKYYNIKKSRESKIEILKLILKLKIFWFRFQPVQILQLSLQSVQMSTLKREEAAKKKVYFFILFSFCTFPLECTLYTLSRVVLCCEMPFGYRPFPWVFMASVINFNEERPHCIFPCLRQSVEIMW